MLLCHSRQLHNSTNQNIPQCTISVLMGKIAICFIYMYFKYLHSERHYNIDVHAQSEHCMTKVTACTHIHLKSKATQKLHNMSKKSVFWLNFLLFGTLRQCCILARSKMIGYFNRILCQGSVKYWSIIWCINTNHPKDPFPIKWPKYKLNFLLFGAF